MPLSKALLVGCGYWGKKLARVLHERHALAAICDANPEAAKLADQYGAPFFSSLQEGLQRIDEAAVVIASPAALHAKMATEALAAGRDVYVEKPISLTLSDAEAVRNLARTRGRIVMTGHLLQYHAAFREALRMTKAGALGKLHYVESNRLSTGQIRTEENVLWSFAPHDISMVLALANEEPSTVAAHSTATIRAGHPDIARLDISFPSGVAGHIHVSWIHPFKEHKLIIGGSEGMLVFDDTQPWEHKLTLYRHGIKQDGNRVQVEKAAPETTKLDANEPLGAEIDHFLDCVEKRTLPRTDANEGLRVLRVLDRAQQALDTSFAENAR